MCPARGRTATDFDFGFLHEPLFVVLAPGSAHTIIRQANLMSGPFFLQHPESESPAVLVLVNSRLAANSQPSNPNLAISLPGATYGGDVHPEQESQAGSRRDRRKKRKNRLDLQVVGHNFLTDLQGEKGLIEGGECHPPGARDEF